MKGRFSLLFMWGSGIGGPPQPDVFCCCFFQVISIFNRGGLNFDSARFWPLFGVTQVKKGVDISSFGEVIIV